MLHEKEENKYLVSFFCHVIIFLVNPGIPSIDRYSKMFVKSENYKNLKEEEQKEYYLCEECKYKLKGMLD